MPTAVRLGRDAKLYLNAGGTFASPTWVAVDNVSDLAVSPAWDEADASTRESKVKLSAKTLLGLEVTGKLRFDLTDASTGTIMDALLSDAVIDVMVLNGPSTVNGVRGFRFEAQVHQATEDQGLGTAIWEDIKLKPYPTANAKQAVKVTTGAPVFTAI